MTLHFTYLTILINNHPVKAFVDCGSNVTLVSADLAHFLRLQYEKVSSPIEVLQGITHSIGRSHVLITINSITHKFVIQIIQSLPYDALIGLDVQYAFDIIIRPRLRKEI